MLTVIIGIGTGGGGKAPGAYAPPSFHKLLYKLLTTLCVVINCASPNQKPFPTPLVMTSSLHSMKLKLKCMLPTSKRARRIGLTIHFPKSLPLKMTACVQKYAKICRNCLLDDIKCTPSVATYSTTDFIQNTRY